MSHRTRIAPIGVPGSSSIYGSLSSNEEAIVDLTEGVRDLRSIKSGKTNIELSDSDAGLTNFQANKRRPSSGTQSERLNFSPTTAAYQLHEPESVEREALQGQLESGLESRFNASAGMPVAMGMGEIEEPEHHELQPSSSSGSIQDHFSTSSARVHHEDPADNSPYPQVRASVSAYDDVSLSINTPRMWTLSLLFSIMGSATNLFFSLRYPSVTITPVVALLLVHPFGRIWDRFLRREDDPSEVFVDGRLAERTFAASPSDSDSTNSQSRRTGVRARRSSAYWMSRRTRLRLWLAQGKWNQKEHACVYIASNVSFGFAFATDVIVEQTQFYHQSAPVLYQILLVLSTQILGYSVAGITRRYLVRPSGMIWPGTLMSTSMFTTLHKDENKPANGWRISRWHFFLVVFLGSSAFYFLPGFLVPALSYFNIMTWFAPNNVIIANLFGVSSGLGILPLTFDWSQIAYTGSPLVVPFWAAMNVVGGLIVVMWLVAPVCYYLNILYTSYLPILSSSIFDNTGKVYDVSRILTPEFIFDEEAYKRYSLVFLPITYVLSYAVQFASLTALLTHTMCWHSKDIIRQWQHALAEVKTTKQNSQGYEPLPTRATSSPPLTKITSNSTRPLVKPSLDNIMTSEDVHSRLMWRYNDVPISWYLFTGAVNLAVGMFVVEYYPVHLPWYGLLLAFLICIVLFIPIGIVMAITNQQSSIYLICQLACGLIFPGRPVANMVFVTYGYIASTQGLKFSSDLKLGQYMKIPPRTLFSLQLAATAVSSLTQIGVLNWSLANIPNVCTPEALNGFSCPIARVHFNGSILWGVVGPSRFFGSEGLYQSLVWAFLIGAIAPVIVWQLGRKNRDSLWQKVNLPLIFGSLSWIPPATALNFSVWALVCFVFNKVIKTKKEAWWRKYTMTLSAALDAGVAFSVGIIFFALLYPGWDWVKGFKWWGTEVYKMGCDWKACAYKALPESGKFGPQEW